MPEDLDRIIERIREQGVEQADKKAEEIINSAREQASTIIEEARGKADDIVAEAEEKTRAIEKRSLAALEQAARDLLLTIEEAVESIFEDLIQESVDKAMDEDMLREVLMQIIGECFPFGTKEPVEIHLSPENGQQLVEYFATIYRDKLDQGLELKTDNEVLKGFRIYFQNRRLYLDYTSEAVAESLANFLRPRLAEIVAGAARIQKGVAERYKDIGVKRDKDQTRQKGA